MTCRGFKFSNQPLLTKLGIRLPTMISSRSCKNRCFVCYVHWPIELNYWTTTTTTILSLMLLLHHPFLENNHHTLLQQLPQITMPITPNPILMGLLLLLPPILLMAHMGNSTPHHHHHHHQNFQLGHTQM